MNWNFERWRTRDRLLEYDSSIVPPAPHSAGLSMVYPWEQSALNQLGFQIWTLAQQHGFDGTQDDLWEKFNSTSIITDILENFPIPGDTKTLYLDIETDILYYFKEFPTSTSQALLESIGAEIVGTSQDNNYYYCYLPIRALLIENTILNCGNAAII